MEFLKITSSDQTDDNPWNWSKPSKAVLAIGMCGGVVILHGAGPVFDQFASEVSYQAGDAWRDEANG